MAANQQFFLSKISHDSLIQYLLGSREPFLVDTQLRDQLEVADRAYFRENDLTTQEIRAKAANRVWDPTKFRNIQLPLTFAQVESAVAYQAGVFLQGVPMFGVVSDPQNQAAAMQLETLIGEQQKRGRWISQFQMTFRDMFKYNLGFTEVEWSTETVPQIDTDTTGTYGKNAANVRSVSWAGNYICRRDPYNMFWDRRCDPTDLHTEGEYAGYTEVWSGVKLKAYIDTHNGIGKQIPRMQEAMDSPVPNDYFIPQIVSELFQDKKDMLYPNWDAFVGISKERASGARYYRNYYEVTTFYARIIPKQHGMIVPQSGTPQIWSFKIVNAHTIIYAERQTNAHNNLPIICSQAMQDGFGYQTKSFSRNVEVFQHLGSALVNMDIASRRRAISDRTIYDPSRIAAKDINSENPSAKIPVRPSAYGKNVQEAVFPFPYRETEQGANIQLLGSVMNFSNIVSGQNPVRQGQFVKGNKTKKEFEDVMGNATGRDQLSSLIIEEQMMTPIKEMLKINILQYQTPATAYNASAKQAVKVDPVQLRQAVLSFKVSDGLIPSEKLISGDEWSVALQTIGTSPQIGAGYNIAPMFSYMMKVRGADLTPFEKPPEQIAYEQAVGAWQQTVLQLQKQNPTLTTFPPQPLPQQFGWNPSATPTGNVQQVSSNGAGSPSSA